MIIAQSLVIKTKRLSPKNECTMRRMKGWKRRKRSSSLAYSIILRSLNIISKSKPHRDKQTNRQTDRRKLSLCLLVCLFVSFSLWPCPVPYMLNWWNYTFYYDTVTAVRTRTMCVLSAMWLTIELALCGITGNQTKSNSTELNRSELNAKAQATLPLSQCQGGGQRNRPSACKVNLKRLRYFGDMPHKKPVNDTSLPHKADRQSASEADCKEDYHM